jgi:hypothetical protein
LCCLASIARAVVCRSCRTLGRTKAPVLHFTFQAPNGPHLCRVELSWFGGEHYYVDEQLVLRQWSLLGKTARFAAHGAEVSIRSQLAKRASVMEVWVNGELIVENLLAEYNAALAQKLSGRGGPRGMGYWLFKVGVWLVLALAFFTLFKWLARHAT